MKKDSGVLKVRREPSARCSDEEAHVFHVRMRNTRVGRQSYSALVALKSDKPAGTDGFNERLLFKICLTCYPTFGFVAIKISLR